MNTGPEVADRRPRRVAVPGDHAVALLAVAAAGGARSSGVVAPPGRSAVAVIWILMVCGVPVVASRVRSPGLWLASAAIALAGATGLLAARSIGGLRLSNTVLSREEWDVGLLTDPQWKRGSVTADGRLDGKHVQIRASGPAAHVLGQLQAGETMLARGRLKNLDGPRPSWLLSRHTAGRLTVREVAAHGKGPLPARFANGIRVRLLKSGNALPAHQRGLFAGFVLGDDRDQSPELVDDFRGSGLSHLLVVSGQNVAFTTAVLEPGLRRLRRRPQLVATLAVLVVFTMVTRFEPSVLRAVWMAGVVATARCLGRPQKALRVLSLAVIALLLVDPLLSYSVGFGLSVAATAGLAAWSGPLGRNLPVPHRVRPLIAPTLAAQAGASLVMIPAFGSVPVVSLLANVAVVPFAGPLMGWGVAAGLPAGFLGPLAGRVVHAPTSLILSFVAWSARTAARAPVGSVSVVPAAAFALVTWRVCRSTHHSRAKVWALALVAVVVWPSAVAWLRPSGVESNRRIERGAVIWTAEPGYTTGPLARLSRTVQVAMITHEVDTGRLLSALRRNRIGAIDVLVVAGGGRPQGSVVRALHSRVSLGAVVVGDAAAGGGVDHVVRVTRATRAAVGDLRIEISPRGGGRLSLQVARVAR